MDGLSTEQDSPMPCVFPMTEAFIHKSGNITLRNCLILRREGEQPDPSSDITFDGCCILPLEEYHDLKRRASTAERSEALSNLQRLGQEFDNAMESDE